jgi:hypothetical protein
MRVQVPMEQTDQSIPTMERLTNAGNNPKRSRLNYSGDCGRNGGNQSAPDGFMRDAR